MVSQCTEINPVLSTDHRVSIPINILPDDQVELREDFRLALISQADNPSTNIRIGPNINTQVVINDDEGRALLTNMFLDIVVLIEDW